MIKQIKKLLAHPLISGSTSFVIGAFIVNGLNYIYTLIMIGALSESEYAVLASLISVVNITFVFSTTILIVFSRFAATLDAQKKKSHIHKLFVRGTYWITIASAAFCVYVIVASMFVYFVSSVPFGILQGLLKFVPYSITNVIAGTVKLGAGVLFVTILGMGPLGGIGGFFVASIVGYIIVLYLMKRYLSTSSSSKKLETKELKKDVIRYAIPVFISSFSFTAFNSLDIILVRHFLEAQSGQYAVLSLMGRSIFFIVSPISSVLLPLIAQKKEKKEHVFGTLMLGITLVLIPCLMLALVYFSFPELFIKILLQGKASEYLVIAPYMGIFAIFITLYSISYLLNSYYFSIGKTFVSILTLIAVILQVILIYLFHDNLYQIIYSLIAVSVLMLVSLLLYYRYAEASS
jgi:O-antigen/teichoic acid export membrane protein